LKSKIIKYHTELIAIIFGPRCTSTGNYINPGTRLKTESAFKSNSICFFAMVRDHRIAPEHNLRVSATTFAIACVFRYQLAPRRGSRPYHRPRRDALPRPALFGSVGSQSAPTRPSGIVVPGITNDESFSVATIGRVIPRYQPAHRHRLVLRRTIPWHVFTNLSIPLLKLSLQGDEWLMQRNNWLYEDYEQAARDAA
jgi:hypothetical protein